MRPAFVTHKSEKNYLLLRIVWSDLPLPPPLIPRDERPQFERVNRELCRTCEHRLGFVALQTDTVGVFEVRRARGKVPPEDKIADAKSHDFRVGAQRVVADPRARPRDGDGRDVYVPVGGVRLEEAQAPGFVKVGLLATVHCSRL